MQGSTVHFDVDAAEPNSGQEQATIFCTQYGSQFGVTEETLASCIVNIQQALEQRLALKMAEETPAQDDSIADQQTEQLEENRGTSETLKFTNQEVFVSSFPLGSKNFEYRYILGVDASANAATFCKSFWSELEGAFVEVRVYFFTLFTLNNSLWI